MGVTQNTTKFFQALLLKQTTPHGCHMSAAVVKRHYLDTLDHTTWVYAAPKQNAQWVPPFMLMELKKWLSALLHMRPNTLYKYVWVVSVSIIA